MACAQRQGISRVEHTVSKLIAIVEHLQISGSSVHFPSWQKEPTLAYDQFHVRLNWCEHSYSGTFAFFGKRKSLNLIRGRIPGAACIAINVELSENQDRADCAGEEKILHDCDDIDDIARGA